MCCDSIYYIAWCLHFSLCFIKWSVYQMVIIWYNNYIMLHWCNLCLFGTRFLLSFKLFGGGGGDRSYIFNKNFNNCVNVYTVYSWNINAHSNYMNLFLWTFIIVQTIPQRAYSIAFVRQILHCTVEFSTIYVLLNFRKSIYAKVWNTPIW